MKLKRQLDSAERLRLLRLSAGIDFMVSVENAAWQRHMIEMHAKHWPWRKKIV